ncbi:MarR family winged helix-turn-helix transcriptional regulator [Maricaulis maris]|uniref:MarR family winged helix-turn-helix transcriptional regulator n=1 Tax=Maricaulis maris TaxID=74318 RepID=UPI003A953B55
MRDSNIMDTHRLSGAFVSNKLLRLVETIADQGEVLLQSSGIIIPPRAISTVLMIGEVADVTAADIATSLDQPHQVATQRVAALIKLELVSKRPHASDSRRKVLEFTEFGRSQYELMMDMLEKIRGAMDALFDELGVDLAAKAVEAVQSLKARPLVDRIS